MEVTQEREEGEMSDDSMSVDEDPPTPPREAASTVVGTTEDDYTILYRPMKEGFIIQTLEKTDSVKVEERARRFGIDLTGNKVISQKQIDTLYENIGIGDANERHIRFDTLHLKGVNGLTTRDIFDYLKDYKPVSLERINKLLCNVVCQDHISAALAILAHSREITDENIKAIANRSPPYYWREGLPHPKSDLILIRFATRSDKLESGDLNLLRAHHACNDIANESSGKNPWGDLCRSWGIYDHQEVYGPKLPPKSYIKTEAGIVRKHPARFNEEPYTESPRVLSTNLAKRLGKRQYDIESSEEESDSDEEWKTKSKLPRMRMRADDEEKKNKSKHSVADSVREDDEPYPSLSIQIENINNENVALTSAKTSLSEKFSSRLRSRIGNPKVGIQSRLGEKVPESSESESSSDDSSSSSQPELNVMSRVHKAPAHSEKKTLSSVWTRLDNAGTKTDLRQTLKTKSIVQSNQNDLRMKLKEKNKRSPLRIEIDNEYYQSD